MAKRKEKTLDAKAAASFLRGWARRFLPGWKIKIKRQPRTEDGTWARTYAFPLDREADFIIYTPVDITPTDTARGMPQARMSWEMVAFHEIAHALVSLPMQAFEQDVYALRKHLPPALADDFERRFREYEEGTVNCLAVSLALAVEDELD